MVLLFEPVLRLGRALRRCLKVTGVCFVFLQPVSFATR